MVFSVSIFISAFQSERCPDLLKVMCLDANSQKKNVLSQVNEGGVDVLLLTPEMLESIVCSGDALSLPPIPFACIDQAECIPEMRIFRPPYIKLNKVYNHYKVDAVFRKVIIIVSLIHVATPRSAKDTVHSWFDTCRN